MKINTEFDTISNIHKAGSDEFIIMFHFLLVMFLNHLETVYVYLLICNVCYMYICVYQSMHQTLFISIHHQIKTEAN